MKVLVLILALSALSSVGSQRWSGGGWEDEEGSGCGDEGSACADDRDDEDEDEPSGDWESSAAGPQEHSYEDDIGDKAFFEEEDYQAALDNYSEEMYDDTFTKPDLAANTDVTIRKFVNTNLGQSSSMYEDTLTINSREVFKKAANDKPSSGVEVLVNSVSTPIPKLATTNSGESSRIDCLLLVLVLTVHWLFQRFSTPRRLRRLVQIRRPAHLH